MKKSFKHYSKKKNELKVSFLLMINIFSFNLKSAEFHFMQEVILITNAHIETLMNIKQSE